MITFVVALSSKGCEKLALSVMKKEEPCGASAGCSFAGAWGGGGGEGAETFYASSYFFDRAVQAGIVEDPKAISATVKQII